MNMRPQDQYIKTVNAKREKCYKARVHEIGSWIVLPEEYRTASQALEAARKAQAEIDEREAVESKRIKDELAALERGAGIVRSTED